MRTEPTRTPEIPSPLESMRGGGPVSRIGYGTMRLTASGALGPPRDEAEARRVLARALDLGVQLFDTAWYYGPDIPNELLAEALRAHPSRVVIATKLGWEPDRSGGLRAAHSPHELRLGMERDLRVLGAASIDIAQLRWGEGRSVDEPFICALEAMIELREEGSFRHIGLSNIGLAQLEHALGMTEIGSVSNSFGVADQRDADVVDFTARAGIAYMPWRPLRPGAAGRAGAIETWARELEATPAQVALAWLLQRAPNIAPIPGTASLRHLEENMAALELRLPDAAMAELGAPASSGP